MRTPALMLLAALATLTGCGREDSTPEGTVKAFMTAVASVDPGKAYALLAPSTRKLLAARAEQASRHTGGRNKLKPEDMILLGLVQPPSDLASVEVVSSTETEARVRLSSGDKQPVVEELTLVNEDGAWRIKLKLPAP